MEVVSLLIKPSSSLCNLRCDYCFYHDVAAARQTKSYGFMDDVTMDVLIKEAYATATKAVVFAFQGGEPTLIGLPFYERFIQLTKQYNFNNLPTSFSIQTNGLLIDDAWCIFLRKNQFLVGISLDGPKRLHNVHRKAENIQDSHSQVMQTIQKFKKHQVTFNILCVVNDINSQHPDKIYDFFAKNKLQYIQLIPCIDDFNQRNKAPSLSPKNFTNFLNHIFERWSHDILEGKKVSIRYFDNLVGMILGYLPQSCDLADKCSYNLVVEANGDVYPCDFYVLDAYKLGNLHQDSLTSIYHHPQAIAFIESSKVLPYECMDCSFYQLCKGGCRRYRESTINTNQFCESYYQFLSKNIKMLEHIAQTFLSNQQKM